MLKYQDLVININKNQYMNNMNEYENGLSVKFTL